MFDDEFIEKLPEDPCAALKLIKDAFLENEYLIESGELTPEIEDYIKA